MESHLLDPIALVSGVVTMIAGLLALLHQVGVFHLGVGPVVLIGCGLLGAGGVALVVLGARSVDPAGPPDQPAP